MNQSRQRRVLSSVVYLVLVFIASLSSVAAQAQTRTDSLGDPLPPRALMRFGTQRFRSPGPVGDMMLADDGQILITAGKYLTAWDAQTGTPLWRTYANSFGGVVHSSYGVRALAVTPDGQQVMTRSNTDEMLYRDVRTGKLEFSKVTQLSPRQRSPISIDISSDNQLFAIGDSAGLTVQTSDGAELYQLAQPHAAPIGINNRDRLTFGGRFHYAIFSPDAKTLARHACGEMKTVFLHDAVTGKERLQIKCQSNAVRMDFSPDSRHIAITERDTAVRLYDASTGNLVWETILEVDRSIENYTSAIRFSPDGKKIAVCERQDQLVLLDAIDGKLIGSFPGHSWNPWAVAFSPDSKTLYSSGWGGTIHRWNLETLQQITIDGEILGTSVVTASSDGNWLAFVDQTHSIHVVDHQSGTEIRKLPSPDAECESLQFCPDGIHLAGGGTAGDSVHVTIWNHQTGQQIHQWTWPKGKDPQAGIEEIAFTRDGRLIAAASFRQDQAYLCDISTGKQVAAQDHNNVYGLCFSADDAQLITAGWDKQLRFWNAENGQLSETFSITEDDIPKNNDRKGDDRMYAVDAESSGEIIATTHLNDRVLFWNADDRKQRGALDISGSFTFGASCFSPDGLWFATGGGGKIEIWDPWSAGTKPEDAKVFEFLGHEKHVYNIQFAGDSRRAVSGAASVSLLWDLRPQSNERPLVQHADNLVHANGPLAYEAWWALVDANDESIDLLRNRIPQSRKLINVGRMISGTEATKAQYRRDLLIKSAATDKQSIRLAAAKRIASVLWHINSKSSLGLLQEIASHDDALGDVAKQQLRLSNSTPPPAN